MHNFHRETETRKTEMKVQEKNNNLLIQMQNVIHGIIKRLDKLRIRISELEEWTKDHKN